MSKKEFLVFLSSRDAPSADVASQTRRDILLSFIGRKILLKFLLFQFLGALFSLSVCPQFGIGLVEGHGIAHIFRVIGDWACAFFCGSLFLSSGLMLSFLAMKGEELWWVWRRYKLPLIFLPALLWGGLMLTSLTFKQNSENLIYHLVWIFSAIGVQLVWMQLRSGIYQHKLAQQFHQSP